MESEIITMLIGFAALYIIIHFYVVQFAKSWSERTTYERFLTVTSAVLLVLMLVGSSQ